MVAWDWRGAVLCVDVLDIPPVGWQSTVLHDAHTTTLAACENTVEL